MKCSLLTLSLFIDDELAADRQAEVDAHMVGCSRCAAGAAGLREQKARVGRLAHVHVDEASAPLLLEQVGIMGRRTPSATASPAAEQRSTSASLPWTPHQPPSATAVIEELTVPSDSPDVQPDLPFDASRSAPHAGTRARFDGDDAAASPEVEAASEDPDRRLAVAAKRRAGADDAWAGNAPADSWEADLPPPLDAAGEPANVWRNPPRQPATPPPPPVAPAAPQPPVRAAAPSRVPAGSLPASAWGRVRDAVAVRMALARAPQSEDDPVVDAVAAHAGRHPAPPLPTAPPTAAPLPAVAAMAPAGADEERESSQRAALELRGAPVGAVRARRAAGVASAPPLPEEERVAETSRLRRPRRPLPNAVPADDLDDAVPAGWNAFAGSSFPPDPTVVTPPIPAPAPRLAGRHTRALAREQQRAVGARVGAVLAPAAAAFRARTSRATAAGTRGRADGLSVGRLDKRLLALAGVALIFIVALLLVRGPFHSTTGPAARPASSSATAVQPQQSVRSQPTATASNSAPATAPPTAAPSAPAASAAPVLPAAQTVGSGASGFQLAGMRFGKQAAFERVVFDLGSAAGGAATPSGTPRTTVSFSSPTTLLVTLSGTLPGPLLDTPPGGAVISSVEFASSDAQSVQYRFTLTRPATTVSFFLASPTRFVLDVH